MLFVGGRWQEVAKTGRLPVVNFAAGGIATPADAALMMQLGVDGEFCFPTPNIREGVGRKVPFFCALFYIAAYSSNPGCEKRYY